MRPPKSGRLHWEDEGDLFRGAEVSEPVPGENALHSHDNVVSVRSEREEDFAGLVEDDDVHGSRVKVDPAIETGCCLL
jgi:hypothetical protein